MNSAEAALARGSGVPAETARRVVGLADGRLAPKMSVSVARWSPADGARSRALGRVAALRGDAALVEIGGRTQWRFGSDCSACATVADDGSVALCRGGDDLRRCGAYEPTVDCWRRAVLVRGVEICALEDVADDPASTDGPKTLWPAAVAAARALEALGAELAGQAFLELGAGSGLPSVAAAVLGARPVVATEQPNAVAFLATNVLANRAVAAAGRVAVEALDWFGACPASLAPRVVVASDCTYNVALHAALLGTLAALLGRAVGAFALVVSDEASTPNAAATLRAFVDAAQATYALDVAELPADGAWRARSPDTVRAFRLSARAS